MIEIGAIYERTDIDPREPLARVQVLQGVAIDVWYLVCDRWDDAHEIGAEELLARYRQRTRPLPPYPRLRALKE